MYRCMTCDVRKTGGPVFLPLDPHKPDADRIGVCTRCAVAIRSFNTLVALAKGEYDEVLAEDGEAQ